MPTPNFRNGPLKVLFSSFVIAVTVAVTFFSGTYSSMAGKHQRNYNAGAHFSSAKTYRSKSTRVGTRQTYRQRSGVRLGHAKNIGSHKIRRKGHVKRRYTNGGFAKRRGQISRQVRNRNHAIDARKLYRNQKRAGVHHVDRSRRDLNKSYRAKHRARSQRAGVVYYDHETQNGRLVDSYFYDNREIDNVVVIRRGSATPACPQGHNCGYRLYEDGTGPRIIVPNVYGNDLPPQDGLRGPRVIRVQ